MLDGPAGQYLGKYGCVLCVTVPRSGSGPACLPGGWRHRMWLQSDLKLMCLLYTKDGPRRTGQSRISFLLLPFSFPFLFLNSDPLPLLLESPFPQESSQCDRHGS